MHRNTQLLAWLACQLIHTRARALMQALPLITKIICFVFVHFSVFARFRGIFKVSV